MSMRRMLAMLLLAWSAPVSGQIKQSLSLDLPKVIALAQSDAPESLLAETRFTNSFWRYKSYQADLRPRLDLSLNSDLNRAINPVILPDGTEKFINRSVFNSGAFFTLRQDLPFTGGTIFAYTSLSRLDNLKTENFAGQKQYFSTPISIRFDQPVFQFNNLRWNKILQPLNYELAQKDYSADMEEVAYRAVQNYFQLLTAQLSLGAAEREKANADTLLSIGRGRYSVGKIAEVELLQLELRAMNAYANLAEAELNVQSTTEQLRNFLGLKGQTNFSLVTPEAIPEFTVDESKALQMATLHRPQTLEFRRRLLEAEMAVDEATKSRGINVGITGRFGLSQSGEEYNSVYQNLISQELISFDLTIPIADWGKTKAYRETALSNQRLIQMTVDQAKINFERDITIKVQQLTLKRESVNRQTKALEAAEKRLDLTQNRYLIGKVDLTELNLANDDRETNRQSFVNALRSFWEAYYEIRLLTLYDFINEQPLVRQTNKN